MIQNILSYKSKSLTGAALILGFASLISRLVGVARDRILAHQFGAGIELDIYTAAFRIPDFIYNLLIVGALSAGFIPIFLELFQKDKKDAWAFVSRVINATFLLVSGVSVVLYFFAPHIVSLLVPGFGPEAQKQTIDLTRVMLLSPILLGLSAIVSGVLQSLKAFFIYSLAPVLYNIGIIVGALFFVPHFGLVGLAYGVVLGAFLHLLIQIPIFLSSGFHYSPKTFLKDKKMKQLVRALVPRTLTLASVQITTLVLTFFASFLGTGSIAIFNFASNISSLGVGIIGISFAMAAFPTLSEYVAKKDLEGFKKQLALTTRQILFFILPLTILFILLRAQIVRVLLGTGAFNWENTIVTATTVGMFSLSLFSQCLLALYSRAFFALHNGRTPLMIAMLSLFITVSLSFYFKTYFGVAGLALGISLGSMFQAAFLFIGLRKILGANDENGILELIAKLSLCCLGLGLTTQFLKYPISLLVNMETFVGIFLQGLICGLAGLLVYSFLAAIFKVPELSLLFQSLRRKWLKTRNIPAETDVLK